MMIPVAVGYLKNIMGSGPAEPADIRGPAAT